MSHAVKVPARGDPAATEVAREAITMALYVSLSLLAVMVALPPQDLVGFETPALLVAEIALLSVISGVAYASSRKAAAGVVLVVKNLVPH